MMDIKEKIKLYEQNRQTPEQCPELFEHMRSLLAIHLIQKSFPEYIPLSDNESLGAAQYISIMVHPEQPTKTVLANRERLFKALIYARLFQEKGGRHKANKKWGREKVKMAVEKFGLQKQDWEKTDATLRVANNKLMQMLYGYHSFTRFQEYLVATDEIKRKGIRYFLANTARGYPHLDFDPDEYQSLLESEGISKSDRLSDDDLLDRPDDYWEKSKPSLHLIEGFCYGHLYNYPLENRHLYHAINNFEWVEKAVKLSHLSLARRLLEVDMVKLGASSTHRVKFDVEKIVFIDSSLNPFFG